MTVRPGYTPAPGERFQILTADGVSGKFDQVDGAIAVYGSNDVTIVFAPSFDVDALARCGKAIAKAGGAFASARSSALGLCVQSALKCVQTVVAGPTRDTCLVKARTGCIKQLDKIDGAEGKFRSAVGKACATVSDSTLLGTIGLGFDVVASACAADFTTPLTTLASVTECTVRQHACTSDVMVGAEWPRASELLGLAGVPPAEIAGLACLPNHPGTGADLGDPAAVGKAAVRCAQKTGKAGQKLVAARLKALQSCATATFACVSNKFDEPTCVTKATGTCTKAFASLAKTESIVADTIAKSCAAPLAFTALAGPAGANLDASAAACADVGVGSLATVDDYARCLFRRLTCGAEALLRFQAPRSAELFTAVGRSATSAFCP